MDDIRYECLWEKALKLAEEEAGRYALLAPEKYKFIQTRAEFHLKNMLIGEQEN